MSTIDKLVAKYSKVPGDIKITCEQWDWGSDGYGYFIPFYKDGGGIWNGLDQDKASYTVDFEEENWMLYLEPKKKIKLYKWVYYDEDGCWRNTEEYFESKEGVNERLVYKKLTHLIQRLDYTCIEVDDE